MEETDPNQETEKKKRESSSERPARSPVDGGSELLEEILSRLQISEAARWTELVAAILLSIAVVGSAFSAWQATKWSGEQAISFAEASANRVQASSVLNLAAAEISYDAMTFVDAVVLYAEGREDLISVFEERLFREDFKPFVDEWLALDPLNNPDAPKTPFDLPDYENPSVAVAELFQEEAEANTLEAKDHNKASDDYILSTVFFAAVLFFAGISTKFRSPTIRWATLFMAVIGLAAAAGFFVTLPRHGV
jgi:hypothetical protein